MLGVTLTPGQYAFASVAYDGDPITTELQRQIFGGQVDTSKRRVVTAVVGARGGKSYILIALRLLHGALTRRLSTLAPGERAVALVVAPDLRLSRQVIGYVRGAIRASPVARWLDGPDNELSVTLRRPDGRQISIEALPATRGGSAVRGRSLTDAALDECAFFRDGEYAVNDDEIYKAVAPRVLPGGQVILASTPWAESGLLYDMFANNYGHPVTGLAAHAPTLLLHDSEMTRTSVETERLRDPDNARREFDAEFMTSGTGQFFDSAAIKGSVQDYDADEGEPTNGRTKYSMGVDLGFKSDSSAAVVVGWDGSHYRVVLAAELRPAVGRPLVPSDVVAHFAAVAKQYGVTHVISDGHYREAILEHLSNNGLGLEDAPAGALGKQETYLRARAVLHEGKCILPNHPRLLAQLKAVISRPTPGGGLTITSPRKPSGGHGDLVSAWVLAVHRLAHARIEDEKMLAPRYGTVEYDIWQFEQRERAQLEKDKARYGRKSEKKW